MNPSEQSNEDADSTDVESDDGMPDVSSSSDALAWSKPPSLSPLPFYVGNMTPLGPDYHGPGPFDVICARGKQARQWSGNVKLKATIKSKLEEYANASSKLAKTMIVSAILDGVREDSPGGGFVKYENGVWFEVGDHLAREKIGQNFRDLLHTKYRSSTKAKVQRKRAPSNSSDWVIEPLPLETAAQAPDIHASSFLEASPAKRQHTTDDLTEALAGHGLSNPDGYTQLGYFHSPNSGGVGHGSQYEEYCSVLGGDEYGGQFGHQASLPVAAILCPSRGINGNEHPYDLKRSGSDETKESAHDANNETTGHK